MAVPTYVANLQQLKQWLSEDAAFSALCFEDVAYAINGVMAHAGSAETVMIGQHDEIAFFPPVTGANMVSLNQYCYKIKQKS